MGFSKETFAITHPTQSHLDLGTAGRVWEEEYKAWIKVGPPHWTLSATPSTSSICHNRKWPLRGDRCLSL